MATYRKRGSRWRAEVNKKGFRESATFDTKAQAVAWATRLELELSENNQGKAGRIPDKTFADLMDRYATEISVNKKGARWEYVRIKMMQRYPLAKVPLKALSEDDFIAYRDTRLKSVSPSAVNREFSLLSHICHIGCREWKWLKENYAAAITRPKKAPPRDRRITEDEIERISFASGYECDKLCTTTTSRVGAAFLFAIETAMRAGEIVKLRWQDVDLDKRVAKLYDTKNGTNRSVPLTREAVRIIRQMPECEEVIFNVSSSSLDAIFRRLKEKCAIQDLHFHDTRHEAITRLAGKFDNVLDLARAVGHRDIRMLQVYYNASAEELAAKLD